MEERDYKKMYARQLLLGKKPFDAALSVFNDNTAYANAALVRWGERDPEIEALQREIIEDEGDEKFLPTRVEFVNLLMEHSRAAFDPEAKVKFLKLAADVLKLTSKDQINISTTNNKVMIVESHGSDENWEQAISAQQTKLLKDSQPKSLSEPTIEI